MIEGWLRGIDLFAERANAVNFRGDGSNGWIVEHRAEGQIDLESTLDFGKELSAE
jgi:hypothetical protein